MERLAVAVHGAGGRMGREVVNALCQAEDTYPVGAVARNATTGDLPLPDASGSIPLSTTIEGLLDRVQPQVVVDFTSADGALAAARALAPRGVHLVSGVTALGEAQYAELDALAQEHEVGVVVAPNFALGAVLLIHLARQIGRFFPYADVVETHHEAKKDSPSGTALAIARALSEGRGESFQNPRPETETLPGTRGGEHQGVAVHAVRMQGRLAHHEVVLGTQGQSFTLRHDTINRECYMPGVLSAVRYVVQSRGLTVGLARILGLE